ncbi:MAG: hypothetical protein WC022_02315 [Parcubacteria group bacterium]
MKKIFFLALVCVISLSVCPKAHAQDWVFDPQNIGGHGCSDNGTGAVDHPFCSVFNKVYYGWNAPQAGDTIYLRGGTWTGRQFWMSAAALQNGTAAHPIEIRPYPGDTVVFDGSMGNNDYLIQFVGNGHNYLHFIGPFEVKNYVSVLDSQIGTVGDDYTHRGMIFKDFYIHDGGEGFYMRHFSDTTIDGLTCLEMHLKDNHSVCVGWRGDTWHINDNLTIKNSTCSGIWDGRTADEKGDADCFWGDQFGEHLYLYNLEASRAEEDGIDFKSRIIEGHHLISHDNGACGFKVWGESGLRVGGVTVHYSDILAYRNSETGLKSTGAFDVVHTYIDNATLWGNGQDDLKNTRGGVDGSDSSHVYLRNSILGLSKGVEYYMVDPGTVGNSIWTEMTNSDLFHDPNNVSSLSINPNCGSLSGHFTTTEYTNGYFNTLLSGGYSCAGSYIYATATNPMSIDPLLISPAQVWDWQSVGTGTAIGNTLTLFNCALTPWPNPVVGHYVEINADGIRRQITAVGDGVTDWTITFTPALDTPVAGSVGNGEVGTGFEVQGWASNVILTNNFLLSPTSPVKNAGVFVPGITCAQADDNGGSSLTNCIHWSGTAPSIGYTGSTWAADTTTYTIGGSISGLVGSVILEDNGIELLAHSTNDTFTFAGPLHSSNTYAVTVSTQPAGQTCTVTNGTGTVTSANVTNIDVTCTGAGISGGYTGYLHTGLAHFTLGGGGSFHYN